MTSLRRSPVAAGLTRLAEAARERTRPPRPAPVAAPTPPVVPPGPPVDADLQFSLTTLLAGRAGADRRINKTRYATLDAEIRRLTGVADARPTLAQAYASMLDVEARGLGRIAGSTYNILGKLVVPPLLSPPPGPVLEIGTLYGLFSPALMRSFRRFGQFRHLTVIDPLAGEQVQGGRTSWDDPSGTPVVEDVVRRNVDEFGLGADEFRLVTGLSTDDDVRATAGDRAYAVVVIDGDHYEDGVAADLRWVETILAPGGIAVMDDFGDHRWPGVERAVHAYLADGGSMQLLGRAATSAYLRRPLTTGESS